MNNIFDNNIYLHNKYNMNDKNNDDIVITKPNDIVICCIAKNEEGTIVEWINHHINLGFDKVIIYDNNDEFKKDNIHNIVNKYLSNHKDKIIIKPCHDKVSYQTEAYNDFYKNNKFKWCAFIDCDEFIELFHWKTIKDMVNDNMFKDANQISIYWKEIGDNDIIEAPDNFIYDNTMFKNITDKDKKREAILAWRKLPLSYRFHKYSEKISEHDTIKSIIRGYDTLIKDNNIHNIHDLEISIHITNIPRTYLINGYLVKDSDKVGHTMIKYNDNHYTYGLIKHYRTLSLSEYLERKFGSINACGELRHSTLRNYYYKLNNETEQKNKYFHWFVINHNLNNIVHIYKDITLVEQDNKLKYILNGYDENNGVARVLYGNTLSVPNNRILNGLYLHSIFVMFDYIKFVS